jgi:hypothetical protein
VVTWETVCRLAEALPAVEDGTSYGQPALRVRGKLFAWMSPSEHGALALRVDPDERALACQGCRRVLARQPPRDDLRDAVVAHRDAVEDVRRFHRPLLVGDDDELRPLRVAA